MPICITGMHRSGASMLAQELASCGLYFGARDELPRPGPDCPQGSWENLHFRSLNEAILASLGAGWDLPPARMDDWGTVAQVQPLRGQAAALVRRLESHAPWGWKDPRSSLTLPFWQGLVPDLKVVICLRNPLEVARSLHQRNACSDAFAFRLWLAYYEHLLSALSPEHRIVTHYDAHLHDPRAELQRVLRLLQLRADGMDLTDAVALVSPSFRHEWATTADLLAAEAPPDVVQRYLALCGEAGPVCQRALEEVSPLHGAGPRRLSSATGTTGRLASIAPVPQSLLTRGRRLAKRGRRVWRHDGPAALLRGAWRKARRLPLRWTARAPRTSVMAPNVVFAANAQTMDCDVIALVRSRQGGRPGRVEHLAEALARGGRRVLLVRSSQPARADGSLRALGPNLVELTVSAGHPQEDALHHVDALRREAGIFAAVCLVEDPAWAATALALRRRFGYRLVYDYAAPAQLATGDGDGAQARDIVSSSDLVLAATDDLLAEASARNPRCQLLPDGCDFERFRFPPHGVPAAVERMSRPILGCFGLDCQAFDAEGVRHLAESRPRWSFLCAGPVLGRQASALRDLPNVHLVETDVEVTSPAIVHAVDVCLLPVRDDPGERAQVRLWTLDLLSSGKPIVAAHLSDLAGYEPHIALAADSRGWLAAVESVLSGRSQSTTQDQVAFARGNTWRERALQFSPGMRAVFPRASIIVVSYNNLDYTRLCLESIYSKTVYPNVETIVVDNASHDGSREFLLEYADQHPALRVILNEANEGFARANNRGLREATGDYLVLLNNDTVVTRGWLCGLVRHLQDPTIGLIGPVTNWAANESRIQVDYAAGHGIDAFASRYTAAHDGKTFDIPMLLFFCVAMQRSVFDAVGPLDERFGVGLCEDRDYAYRVREAGHRVVCAEDVFVHHFGSASFSKLGDQGYARLFERNRRLLEEKWGVPWQGHEQRM